MFFWNLKITENQLVSYFYSVEGQGWPSTFASKCHPLFPFLNEETLYFSYAQFLSRHNGCDFKNGFVLPTRTTRNRQKTVFASHSSVRFIIQNTRLKVFSEMFEGEFDNRFRTCYRGSKNGKKSELSMEWWTGLLLVGWSLVSQKSLEQDSPLEFPVILANCVPVVCLRKNKSNCSKIHLQ